MTELSPKELLLEMVKCLVDDLEGIRINEIAGGTTTILELYVTKSDLGKVIGKRGMTAKSLRTILTGTGAKKGKRVVLEIMDEG